jgi:hypothetical protein
MESLLSMSAGIIMPDCAISTEQADGLERDGLAAGVRSRDHDQISVVVEIDIDRHDGFLVEQRVAARCRSITEPGCGKTSSACFPCLGVALRGWKVVISGRVASST